MKNFWKCALILTLLVNNIVNIISTALTEWALISPYLVYFYYMPFWCSYMRPSSYCKEKNIYLHLILVVLVYHCENLIISRYSQNVTCSLVTVDVRGNNFSITVFWYLIFVAWYQSPYKYPYCCFHLYQYLIDIIIPPNK